MSNSEQPANNTPAAVPAQPADNKYLDKYQVLIALGTLLVGAVGGIIGYLTYNHLISKPAAELAGNLEVSAFFLAPPTDYNVLPGIPKPIEEVKPDPNSAQLHKMKKQFKLTLSNDGSKRAEAVRLILPEGSTYALQVDANGPSSMQFVSDTFELGSLEINSQVTVYIWSTEPVSNWASERIAIAHDGGRLDVSSPNTNGLIWVNTTAIVFSIILLILGFGVQLTTMRRLKRLLYSKKEKEKELAASNHTLITDIETLRATITESGERVAQHEKAMERQAKEMAQYESVVKIQQDELLRKGENVATLTESLKRINGKMQAVEVALKAKDAEIAQLKEVAAKAAAPKKHAIDHFALGGILLESLPKKPPQSQ